MEILFVCLPPPNQSTIWGINYLDEIRSVSLDLQAYYYIDLFSLHDEYSEGNFSIQIADSPNGPWTTVENYLTAFNNDWVHLTNIIPFTQPIRYLRFIADANNTGQSWRIINLWTAS